MRLRIRVMEPITHYLLLKKNTMTLSMIINSKSTFLSY